MKDKPTYGARAILLDVLTLCMQISINTKADCFFSYEPHCNSYSVNIHMDGWKSGEEAEFIEMVTDITEDNIKATVKKLAAIYCDLEVLKYV